jgi:glycosyltransferase involved in cell wall biosynthesis
VSERVRRVLFVLEHYAPYVGGVETLFTALVSELARRGTQVRVITSKLPGVPSREVRDGAEIVRVRSGPAGRYGFTFAAIPTVLRYARDADLIHTTTYNAAAAASLAGALLRVPSVITVHEVFDEQWLELRGMSHLSGMAHRFYERAVLALPFDWTIADSDHTRRRFLARSPRSPETVVTVYGGIDRQFWRADRHKPRDLRLELGLPEEGFVYLFFGRPGVSKGVEYLIDAVPEVTRLVPDARLVMLLGRDPDHRYRAIVEQIERLGVRDSVIVHDSVPREELPGWLLGADCVVVPSVSEGFGYAALEAALLGSTVISTTGHSVEEILGDSVTLVPPGDSGALANAIVAVRRRAKEPSPALPRKAPGDFSVAAHVDAVLDVYARIVRHR